MEMRPDKPDYENMSGAELLAAYNSMAENPRKSKFETKVEAIRKCNALWAQKSGALKVVADNGGGPREKENYPAPKGGKRDRKAAMLIEILVKNNPHREGTTAYRVFNILAKSKTWGEFFSHFQGKERKDAGLYLKADMKKKYVQVVNPR